ncbi:MAG: tRNA epoxyqueuosine(34) reductase QueG [Acidobacteriota bacterium]|nr:tRNA epoxyqueuosine(34) reductase QueG [Acidobacteriota bacterium]
MNHSIAELSNLVKDFAREAGFELSGIAPLRDFVELEQFPRWIYAGHAGEMDYLKARNDSGQLKRSSPRETFPWARSVIVCAINYNTTEPYSTEIHDASRGWIARYAWSKEDYHRVVLRKLKLIEARLKEVTVASVSTDTKGPSHSDVIQTRCYVDTGPIVERIYAKYAGVGWIGKNTCILNQGLGSWLFLGVILTSLELPPDLPAPDRCGSCTRCIQACPTEALIAPYQLDSTKCISYLTIEKRGILPEEMRAALGRHVFGCDICQDVCPWNRKAPATNAAEFQPRERLVNPALEWLAGITDEEFQDAFRGSPIKRSKRTGLRRNAVLAMGNSGDDKFAPVLTRLSSDEDHVVSDSATWALRRLRGASTKLA